MDFKDCLHKICEFLNQLYSRIKNIFVKSSDDPDCLETKHISKSIFSKKKLPESKSDIKVVGAKIKKVTVKKHNEN